jgi:hypothetical protein
MGRREDLLRREAEAWGRFDGVVETLSSAELVRPGYTAEGWSVKDMVAHVAAWSNVAASVLREISAGTWSGHHDSDEPGGIDRLNAEWFERDRELDVDTVRSNWRASRTSLLESFGARSTRSLRTPTSGSRRVGRRTTASTWPTSNDGSGGCATNGDVPRRRATDRAVGLPAWDGASG